MNAPTLDGKHRAVAIDTGHDHQHTNLIFIEPAAEFTAVDGLHKAGEFYHVGLMMDGCAQFTKRPCRPEFIPELLAWFHLDHTDLKWTYVPSAGVKRNFLWRVGDGGWLEAKQLAEIEALRTRAVKEVTNTNSLVNVLWDDGIVLLPPAEFARKMAKVTAKVDERIAEENAEIERAHAELQARYQAADKKRSRKLATILGAGVSERKLLK